MPDTTFSLKALFAIIRKASKEQQKNLYFYASGICDSEMMEETVKRTDKEDKQKEKQKCE